MNMIALLVSEMSGVSNYRMHQIRIPDNFFSSNYTHAHFCEMIFNTYAQIRIAQSRRKRLDEE